MVKKPYWVRFYFFVILFTADNAFSHPFRKIFVQNVTFLAKKKANKERETMNPEEGAFFFHYKYKSISIPVFFSNLFLTTNMNSSG